MNRRLFVGNLPFQTSEDDLQQLFAQAGPVESVRVMRDQATGRARGFAFVEMATDDAARTAIDKFNQTDFGGRAIAVNEARPQAPRPGGFDGGGGRGGGGGRRDGRGGGPGRRSEPRW
jgi:RNA recognition motif-containing protein